VDAFGGTIPAGEVERSAKSVLCGAHNYNIIPLSSVIPPGSVITTDQAGEEKDDEFGHRLYVVKAEARASVPGHAIAAGIGWFQWGDNRGLLVEHEVVEPTGSSETAKRWVADRIVTTLRDLVERRGGEFDATKVGSTVAATRIDHQPACALALAIFQAQGWD
jgi:arginine decarboxylase